MDNGTGINLAKLKIGFIAGSLGQGGAERQLFYILKTLSGFGCKPQLFSLSRGEFWEEKIRDLGVPITWVRHSRSSFQRLLTIVKLVHERDIRILQSHHFFANPYAAFTGKLLRIFDIGAIRNDVLSEVRMNGPILGQICLRSPNILAANSQLGIRNALMLGASEKRLRYLPNVVDCHHFVPGKQGTKTKFTLLNIGRMCEQKNQGLFLDLLATLHRQGYQNIQGVIAGDGPDRKPLELRAIDQGLLPDIVHFVGNVDDPLPLYQSASAFVLSSDWEGTPNVIMEAMACGLPVISTNVGGTSDLISDKENGLLIEPGDLPTMVNAVCSLMEDPKLCARLGSNARQFVLDNFDLSHLSEILTRVYASLSLI